MTMKKDNKSQLNDLPHRGYANDEDEDMMIDELFNNKTVSKQKGKPVRNPSSLIPEENASMTTCNKATL